MKDVKKSSSGVPVAIIVLVLVLVVAGGFWFYQTSKPGARTVATNSTQPSTQRTPINMAAAPPGAQPPHSLGSPTATVTLEEFADYQCGSCAAAHPILKNVQRDYGANANFRFVFRNFPLAGHDKAYEAALAAEAAGMQGTPKFWQMQDQIFSNQHLWSNNQNYLALFAEYAQKIGLDVEKFKADMASGQARSRVDQDRARGAAVGVSSTPTIFVNGKPVPYQELSQAGLKRIIDAELQAAAQPAQTAPANAAAAPANTANANK